MTTNELIAKLRELDPGGEMMVVQSRRAMALSVSPSIRQMRKWPDGAMTWIEPKYAPTEPVQVIAL